MDTLPDLIAHADPWDFPYQAVVAEYRRVGKHFVGEELLGALGAVRAALPATRPDRGSHGRAAEPNLLARFLDCALDKWDGRYDYTTYTALNLLPTPAESDLPDVIAHRDWLVLLLVTDALRFELRAADGATDLLPQLRPDRHILAKRCRLGLRAVWPEPERHGLTAEAVADDPVGAARQVCATVRAGASTQDGRMLMLSMLPVYVVHDEYLFIRVLQSFEATFALLAVLLRRTIEHLVAGSAAGATQCLDQARLALRRAAPLFSLLATMQVAAFQTFRQFTEGASAIQSRSYKAMEALCRRPDDERLNSPAYRSVPEVRRQVLHGVPNIDATLGAASAAGRLVPRARGELVEAMRGFSETLAKWRETHYRLAVRMLGERPGTGYTEGTPYLRHVLSIPVFRSIEIATKGSA